MSEGVEMKVTGSEIARQQTVTLLANTSALVLENTNMKEHSNWEINAFINSGEGASKRGKVDLSIFSDTSDPKLKIDNSIDDGQVGWEIDASNNLILINTSVTTQEIRITNTEKRVMK